MRWRWLLVLTIACGEDGGGLTLITGDGLFEPAALDFGERAIGPTHELETTLTNPRVGTLRVTDVRFDPPVDVYAARLAEGGTLRGAVLESGRRLAIKILFAPREARDYPTTMLVVFDDLGVQLSLDGRGREVAVGAVAASPSRLSFGSVEVGRRVAARVTLTNVGDTDTELGEVRLGSTGRAAAPGESFYITPVGRPEVLGRRSFAAKQAIEAEIHFAPTRTATYTEVLELVAGNQITTLPVSGRGEPVGVLSCEPAELSFGALERGRELVAALRCTPRGGVFTVDEVRLETGGSARFTVAAAPPAGTSVGDGRTFEILVRFAAEGLADDHSARLLIRGAHGGVHAVPLRGAVIPPANVALSVRLDWDLTTSDLDLHLVRNDGEPYQTLNDCYFAAKNPDWGRFGYALDNPFLDRDDTELGGPEELNLTEPGEPFYDVYVHLYRSRAIGNTHARVEVILGGTTVYDRTETLDLCGVLWRVGRAHFVGTPRFESVDRLTDDAARAMCR